MINSKVPNSIVWTKEEKGKRKKKESGGRAFLRTISTKCLG